jgi:hypothetical protein
VVFLDFGRRVHAGYRNQYLIACASRSAGDNVLSKMNPDKESPGARLERTRDQRAVSGVLDLGGRPCGHNIYVPLGDSGFQGGATLAAPDLPNGRRLCSV